MVFRRSNTGVNILLPKAFVKGGHNEDIAPMDWIVWTLNGNPTWAKTMYRYDETTGIWYHKILGQCKIMATADADTVVDSVTKTVASGTRRTLILQAEADAADALGLEFLGSIVSGNDAIQLGTTVTHISISDDQLTVTVTLFDFVDKGYRQY